MWKQGFGFKGRCMRLCSLTPLHLDLSITYSYDNMQTTEIFFLVNKLVSLVFGLPFLFQLKGVLLSCSIPLHPNHPQYSCPLLSVPWVFASALRLTRKLLSRQVKLLSSQYKKWCALNWSHALAHHCVPSSHYENSIPQKCFQLLLLFRVFIK